MAKGLVCCHFEMKSVARSQLCFERTFVRSKRTGGSFVAFCGAQILGRATKPKLPAEHAKSRRVTIRFRVGEYSQIESEARTLVTPPADYIRLKALNLPLPPAPLPEIRRELCMELGRVGNNLNQLLKAIHEGRVVSVRAQEIEPVVAMLKKIKAEVAGLSSRRDKGPE